MAKITQYPAKTVPSNNDEFVFHEPASGSTKKMTRGDLIGGAPLPANSVNAQAIAPDSVGPAQRTGGFKVGTFSIASGASGSLQVTGVGFEPKFIRITELPAGSTDFSTSSYGATDGTSQFVTGTRTEASFRSRWTQTNAVVNVRSATNSSLVTAVFSSFDSDGFTLTIAISTAAINFAYEAFA